MACPNSPLMEVAFDVPSCQINRVFQSVIIATRVQPSPKCFFDEINRHKDDVFWELPERCFKLHYLYPLGRWMINFKDLRPFEPFEPIGSGIISSPEDD